MSRRILITGGTGFLGAALAARARGVGHTILTMDVAPEADIVCDLGQEDAVRRAVAAARPEVIVHLAARLTDAGDTDPIGSVRTNALGTAALFAAAEASGARRVIYASSIAAVGPCAPGTGDATMLDPRTIYGVTKAFGEHLARAMSLRPAAPVYLVLRFGWIYGPGRKRGWRDLQALIEQVAAGERRVEYPDYADPVDWTWVDDATAVLTRCIECDAPRFAACNAVGDLRRVADAIAHLKRRFPDLEAVPVPAGAPASAWGLVNDGLAALIGPSRVTRLEQGIDRMLEDRGVVSSS